VNDDPAPENAARHDESHPPRRLVADEPLPPYSYVPGRFPHPIADPTGHQFGKVVPPAAPIEPHDWASSRAYLFGCDLFNLGYYWEAHETWESVWLACGRRGVTADFLKGLIKLAAAGVKAREGRPVGVVRHGTRAAELFRLTQKAIDSDRYLGLEFKPLLELADRLAGGEALPPPSDAVRQVLFTLQLRPHA